MGSWSIPTSIEVGNLFCALRNGISMDALEKNLFFMHSLAVGYRI